MKKGLALITVVILAVFFFDYRQTAVQGEQTKSSNEQTRNLSELKAQNFRAVAFGISPKVSDLAPASPDVGESSKKSADEQARAVPNNKTFRKEIPNAVHDADNALTNFSDAPMPPPSLTFDGVSSSDNAAAYGYAGGAIVFGNLIGKIADNGTLEIRYQHLNQKGELMTGKCFSTPETLSDGRIRLREKWQWTSGDLSEGESIVEEIIG